MNAGDIYCRLPGLTEGEAVVLALAYHLGAADADAARATRPADARATEGVRRGARRAGGGTAGRVVRGGFRAVFAPSCPMLHVQKGRDKSILSIPSPRSPMLVDALPAPAALSVPA